MSETQIVQQPRLAFAEPQEEDDGDEQGDYDYHGPLDR